MKRIRAALSFSKLLDSPLLTWASAILAWLFGNAAFPNPPVERATYEAGLDKYAAAITAALDGGKQAIAERNKQRQNVISMLRQLATYVESVCPNDLSVFLSSGFEPAAYTRTTPQPLTPIITRIDQGNSGELIVAIKALPAARTYEVRHAPLQADGTSGTWTTTTVVNVKPPASINNLMPGTTYSFQVRALSKLGYSAWSDSVNRMTI